MRTLRRQGAVRESVFFFFFFFSPREDKRIEGKQGGKRYHSFLIWRW